VGRPRKNSPPVPPRRPADVLKARGLERWFAEHPDPGNKDSALERALWFVSYQEACEQVDTNTVKDWANVFRYGYSGHKTRTDLQDWLDCYKLAYGNDGKGHHR
jgi:hypothetical protein